MKNKNNGQSCHSFLTGAIALVFASGSLPLFVTTGWGYPIQKVVPTHVRPVSDEILDQMRGGFSWGGMSFSFGIQSATFVNGQLMVETILQTIGTNLQAKTGFNPFASGGSSVLSSPNPAGDPPNKQSGLSPSSLGITNPPSGEGNSPPVNLKNVENLPQTGSGSGNTVSNVVQISPKGSGNVGNIVSPTAFSSYQGIVSVLQNTASNVVIHNLTNMNATISNVGTVNRTFMLNNLFQETRFLSR